jgi:hypothetical protein
LTHHAFGLAQTKVQKLDDLLARHVGHEDVLGLQVAMHDGDRAFWPLKVVRALERARDGCQQAHELLERQGRLAIGAALADQRVERVTLEPLQHQVRNETTVGGRERVDVERPHDRRNAGGKPEQELRLGAERSQEMQASVGRETRRQPQAFERHRRAKPAVMGSIHGTEAAFGHHGLHMIRRSDHGADDAESVLCHLFAAA